MTSTECAHEEFQVSPLVHTIDGPEAFTFITLAVRCARCQVMFHFRGLNSGQPNPNEPVVSADGFELRAPLAPGPGAVVGLLVATGLTERLVPPTNGEEA